MKVKVKTKLPAQYLFNQIIDSAIKDISQQTGTSLPKDKLAGFTFNKTYANNQVGTLTVTDFIDGEKYAYEMHVGPNSHKVSYVVAPLGDSKSSVTYEEHVGGDTSRMEMNNVLTAFILGFARRGRLKKMTNLMEQKYQNLLA